MTNSRYRLVRVVLLSTLVLTVFTVTLMKVDFLPRPGGSSDSKHTMGGGSSHSMVGGPSHYKHTMGGVSSDCKHTMGGEPSDSKHTMGAGPSDSNRTMEAGPGDSNHTMEGDAKRAQPRFVYAIQTESCLPIHLKKALGNPDECNCDVLVLSYKQSCTAVSLRHIKYINGSSLSWPEGRNLMWQVAKSRHIQYLYYIFVDDDIVLNSTKTGNPWRQFERFLFNIEPAVAAVETDTNPYFPRRKNAIQHNKCVVDQPREYFTTASFDDAFVAYHYQTLGYLLPYATNHIKKSWWMSAVRFRIKCEVTFRGQVVLHTQITGTNPDHRPYPRGISKNGVLVLVSEVVKEIPGKYRNNSVLLGWKRDGMDHERLSSTYCLPPPPPHMPIKPFALLEAPIPCIYKDKARGKLCKG